MFEVRSTPFRTAMQMGATENAGPENAGMRDHQKCRGGKRRTGKRRTIIRGWKTRDQLLWNAEAAKRQSSQQVIGPYIHTAYKI